LEGVSVIGIKELGVFYVWYTNIHIIIIICGCDFFFLFGVFTLYSYVLYINIILLLIGYDY